MEVWFYGLSHRQLDTITKWSKWTKEYYSWERSGHYTLAFIPECSKDMVSKIKPLKKPPAGLGVSIYECIKW